MEVYYKLEFSYPDGHIEEFADQYRSAKEAVEIGENMLNQVKVTERYHQYHEDAQEAYFLVTKIDGDKHRLVFDSRGL